MAKKHKRRSGYNRVYARAAPGERAALIGGIIAAVKRNPPPGAARRGRGRPRRHPWAKMGCIAVLAAAFGLSSRQAEGEIPSWNLPWPGGAPDHATICRAMAAVSEPWLDALLADTVKSGLAAVDFKASGSGEDAPKIIGVDSSGLETDRYETRERPDKKAGEVAEQRRKIYGKFHTTAPLGPQLTLSCRVTGSDVPDTTQLPTLVDLTTKWHGDAFRGVWFAGDRGYDSEADNRLVYAAGMRPVTKRREPPQPGARVNRGKPNGRRAAEEFDADVYKWRGLIDGLFWGLESKNRRLHCRYIREDARERWGPVTAMGWNPVVPDRLECAGEMGVKWTVAVNGAAAA